MRPRDRIVLLSATTVVVAAFVAAALLDQPSSPSSSAPSPTASSTRSGSGAGAATEAPSASGFYGAALPANVRARDFTLTDQSGRPVTLSRYRGQVVVLAFLYSSCGPTCNVIAQQIRGALDELERPVPVLIVSAAPRADTPARVRGFLAQVGLSGRVRYLTGPPARLPAVWQAYGVVPASASHADFSDSASVLLIDRSGYERVLYSIEQLTPEGLAHDIRKLW
jgi:protein SCO1/2